MKVVLFIFLGLLTVSSMNAFAAGTITSGGDNSTAFECWSAPNVDSSLHIKGYGNEFDRNIEMDVYVGDERVLTDFGVLTESPEIFQGVLFDVVLVTPEDPAHGLITAKAANPVLATGQGNSLKCERKRIL